MTTFNQLVERTITRLSMVSGTGTQIYAEDRIAEMLQHKFDVGFDNYKWPEYNTWETFVLDGSTGIVTTDLSEKIKYFRDIKGIFVNGTQRRVAMLDAETNPNIFSGTIPLVYESNSSDTRVFTIWPKTATGSLDVNYLARPDPFVGEDTVKMDDQYLILGAAYDYLEDDGTNPNATQKMQGFYLDRLKQIKDSLNSIPIPLDKHTRRTNSFTVTTL